MIFRLSIPLNLVLELIFNLPDAKTVAKIMKTKWELGLNGGILIANPIPEEYSLDFDKIEAVINQALILAEKQGIKGKETTIPIGEYQRYY